MKVKAENTAAMGQFYMLRAWGGYPLLSRPISVFDADAETVSFLYKVVGKGTETFAALKPGDEITLDGPHGNGFPEAKGRIALVGGGVGIAPLYLTAKKLRELDSDTIVDIYDPLKYDCIMACGPEIMMKVLYKKCKSLGVQAPVYVSMENRMACGIGACLVCTCKTTAGNKRACKDGPVMLGSEVFGNE